MSPSSIPLADVARSNVFSQVQLPPSSLAYQTSVAAAMLQLQLQASSDLLALASLKRRRLDDSDACFAYERGFCKRGRMCGDGRHQARLLCPYYAEGFCPDGIDCSMSHPKVRLYLGALANGV